MDKTNLLKYFKVSKRVQGFEHKTHLVYDNFTKRDKRLSIISQENYSEFALNHFIRLFPIFSSDKNSFLEYLLDWGLLEDGSLYVLRDARDISAVPDELFNINQIPFILLDILIGLYNIHRNNYYYGGIKREDILYCYNRRSRIDCFSFYLSGFKILKAEIRSSLADLQREDIKSLVHSLIFSLKNRDNTIFNKVRSLDIKQTIDYFIKDKIIKDIILETFRAEEDILYYIRLLIKNLYYNNKPQNKYYNSVINKLYAPDIFIMRHEFPRKTISNYNIIAVNGASGIGKTHYIKYMLNSFRLEKYTPFYIDASQYSPDNYYFIKNFTDLISTILKRNESMIFERFNNIPDEISNEERMYLLYRFDESINPVFILENIENADDGIILLFKSIIEAGIHIIISKNNDMQSEQYIKLIRGFMEKNIYTVPLESWNISEISAFLERILYNENKQKIRIFSELLFKNNIKKPKKIIDILNYILGRESDLFSNEIDDFKNSIEISIGLFSKFKENLIRKLSPSEFNILRTLYLFPSNIESLTKLYDLKDIDLKKTLNALLCKKIIILEKNKYLIIDNEIKNEISAKTKKKDIQKEYAKIAGMLIKEPIIAGSLPKLILADYLLNGNYDIEAAKIILDDAANCREVMVGGKLIRYYNKAYDIFRIHDMKKEQIIILERLFDIHHKRSDYSKAETILMTLNDIGYESFNLYKKYALLLESTGDNKNAIEYYNKAFMVIKNSNDIISKIDIYIDIARLFIKTYKLEQAKIILQKAIKIENDFSIRDRHHILLFLLGEFHSLNGDFDRAQEVLNEAAELSEIIRDHFNLSHILSSLGLMNLKRRIFDKAYVHYKRALELSINSDNIQGISKAHYSLGLIDLALGNFSKAYDQFTNAKIIDKKTGHRKDFIIDNYMISYLQIEKGEISKAYDTVREANEIAEKIRDQELKARMLFRFGRIYHMLGSYGESVNFYFYSREISKKIGMKDHLTTVYSSLAYLLFDLGDYQKAGQFAQKSIQFEKELYFNQLLPLNNAIIAGSKILLNEAEDPLALIKNLKNEDKLPDNFHRFKFYKIIFDAARFIGIRDLMIYCLQMIRELNLGNISIWCSLIEALCQQWVFNDLTEEDLRKNLITSEQMDFGELQWIWEYLLANHLYFGGRHQEAYDHYMGVYEKLKDKLYNVSDNYKEFYISNPFRKFAYNKGEKVFEKQSNLLY